MAGADPANQLKKLEQRVLDAKHELERAEDALERAPYSGKDPAKLQERVKLARREFALAESALDESDLPGRIKRQEREVAQAHEDDDVPGGRDEWDSRNRSENELTRLKGSQFFGCSLPLIAVLLVLGVVLAITGILLFGPDDDAKSNSDRPGTDVQATETSGQATETSGEAAATSGGELSAFAGNWVLESGLDDPSGVFVSTQYIPDNNVIGPSSASITIAEDGTITGGSYHTSKVHTNPGNSPGCQESSSTTDGESASGFVGADGKGEVLFDVTSQDIFQCGNNLPPLQGQWSRFFWITGDTMVLCPGFMESPTTCVAYTGVPATFRRV